MMTGSEPGLDIEPTEKTYSISELTSRIKSILEGALPSLWVEGEISNFVHHSSGHMYFTLKDEKSQISAVMFKQRNARLTFTPENGMKVLVRGRVGVYEPQGRYQFYAERMKPSGLGALAAAFEQLKKKLAAEGLFDEDNKKPLPAIPRTVAVVTSPTGAAVRDVIRVVQARLPFVRLVVFPVRVQGQGAAGEIAEAIRLLDDWGEADVAIVGRGGGSLEDLWPFNEEEVARAIAAAVTPIVSAVGHEVDFTIADFVADARAATPSNAGEIVVPDGSELARTFSVAGRRLVNAVSAAVEARAERVESLGRAYAFRLPNEIVRRLAQRVDELGARVERSVSAAVREAAVRLDRCGAALRMADPAHILARGFAAVRLLPAGSPVRSVSDVSLGHEIEITVADGAFGAVVGGVRPKAGGER